jgi:two-component sensor histidine kinase
MAVAGGSFLLAAVAFLNLVFISQVPAFDALKHSAVSGVLVIGLIFLFTGVIRNKYTSLSQPLLFTLIGCLIALDADWGNFTSVIFVGIGYMLLEVYGFLKKRFAVKTIIIASIYLGMVFLGFMLRREAADLGSLHTLIGLLLVAYLIWLMVSVRNETHKHREAVLEQIVTSRTRKLQEALENKTKLLEEKTALLAEKDLLLREVHHRTKNNMQLISSFLSLENEKLRDPKAAAALENSKKRVQALSIALDYVHESENIMNIDTAQYIEDFISKMWQTISSSHISPQLYLQKGIRININFAITLGIIINELVSNVVEHAFEEDNGSVFITLEQRDSSITLDFRDNGIGFPDSISVEHPQTLGLKLISGLTRQLGGTVAVWQENGTCYRFAFPYNSS